MLLEKNTHELIIFENIYYSDFLVRKKKKKKKKRRGMGGEKKTEGRGGVASVSDDLAQCTLIQ